MSKKGLLVVSKDLCFATPRFVRIDGSKHLDAKTELWTFSDFGSFFRAVAVSKPSTTAPVYELSSPCFFSLRRVRLRMMLQSFSIILGPRGFLHEGSHSSKNPDHMMRSAQKNDYW